MPPKRKQAVMAKPDSSTDIENVNTKKRVKKASKEVNSNGIENEDEPVSSPPKRSRPGRTTRKIVDYDESKRYKTKKSAKTASKSPQPGPSWRITPDRALSENTDTVATKEKSQNGKDKKEKPVKTKEKNAKAKKKPTKAKKDVNIQNGDDEMQNDDDILENGLAPLAEGPKVKELMNKTDTDWDKIDFNCSKKNGFGVKHNLIISTWNVGGVKSWLKKGGLEFLNHERPDILCLQETKCTENNIPEELKHLKTYSQFWSSGKTPGYAGVALLSAIPPKDVSFGIQHEELDAEGRCILAEYDHFYLVNVYVPNSGRKLVSLEKRLEWNEAFKAFISKLESEKPVIVCGDLNVSHNEIDLARPKSNTKNAGFTKEEREGMTEFLESGFEDVYRCLYPDLKDVYSFWTYMANARAKNVGWRLDYFLISKDAQKSVCDMVYRNEIFGSDHCPVTLFINM